MRCSIVDEFRKMQCLACVLFWSRKPRRVFRPQTKIIHLYLTVKSAKPFPSILKMKRKIETHLKIMKLEHCDCYILKSLVRRLYCGGIELNSQINRVYPVLQKGFTTILQVRTILPMLKKRDCLFKNETCLIMKLVYRFWFVIVQDQQHF